MQLSLGGGPAGQVTSVQVVVVMSHTPLAMSQSYSVLSEQTPSQVQHAPLIAPVVLGGNPGFEQNARSFVVAFACGYPFSFPLNE
jgi:hypothetical protein